MTARRKPWVAGLLSVLEPGLGHLYAGHPKKALAIVLLPLCTYPAMYFLISANRIIPLLFIIAVLASSYYFVVTVDAIRCARAQGPDYQLQWFNALFVYLAVVGVVYALSSATGFLFKTKAFQAFKIPAASMRPTLEIGDHIFVDRRSAARMPQRGDLIVFKYPKDEDVEFIKRVAAVGGDTVELKERIVLVNGVPVDEDYVIYTDKSRIPAGREPSDNFGPLAVPPNSYFVLGDNRDNSFDSRYWGIVTADQVKGTARTIYWSWDHDNRSVRWTRIGDLLK